MRHRITTLCAAALTALGTASAGIGVDGSAGTNGLSAHAHFDVLPAVTFRVGGNFFDYEFEDREFDGIEYDLDTELSQFGAYADVHPLLNGFTVTGGIVYGERELTLRSTPTEPIEIGEQTFTPEEVGSLVGEGDLSSAGYYAGIGWDTTTRGLNPIAVVVRAGVIISDSPQFTLSTEGGLAETDPDLQDALAAELAREQDQLNDDVEDLRFYPVLSVGIGFGF